MIVWLFDASCEVIHVVSTQSTKSTSIWCFLSWLFTIWMLLRPRFPTHLLLPTGTTFQIIWTLASVHTQIQSIIRFVGQMLQSMMDRVSCLNNAEQREDIKHFEKLPLSNAQFIFIGFVRVELLPWIECLPVTLGCTTHHPKFLIVLIWDEICVPPFVWTPSFFCWLWCWKGNCCSWILTPWIGCLVGSTRMG